jgi:hypothetical protein
MKRIRLMGKGLRHLTQGVHAGLQLRGVKTLQVRVEATGTLKRLAGDMGCHEKQETGARQKMKTPP